MLSLPDSGILYSLYLVSTFFVGVFTFNFCWCHWTNSSIVLFLRNCLSCFQIIKAVSWNFTRQIGCLLKNWPGKNWNLKGFHELPVCDEHFNKYIVLLSFPLFFFLKWKIGFFFVLVQLYISSAWPYHFTIAFFVLFFCNFSGWMKGYEQFIENKIAREICMWLASWNRFKDQGMVMGTYLCY